MYSDRRSWMSSIISWLCFSTNAAVAALKTKDAIEFWIVVKMDLTWVTALCSVAARNEGHFYTFRVPTSSLSDSPSSCLVLTSCSSPSLLVPADVLASGLRSRSQASAS